MNREFFFRQEMYYCLHISNGMRRDLFHCIYWWLSSVVQRISSSKNDAQWTMRWDWERNKCLYFLLHLLPLLLRKMKTGYQSLQLHTWFIFTGPAFWHNSNKIRNISETLFRLKESVFSFCPLWYFWTSESWKYRIEGSRLHCGGNRWLWEHRVNSHLLLPAKWKPVNDSRF